MEKRMASLLVDVSFNDQFRIGGGVDAVVVFGHDDHGILARVFDGRKLCEVEPIYASLSFLTISCPINHRVLLLAIR